jgi:signal transduction histidine kinase
VGLQPLLDKIAQVATELTDSEAASILLLSTSTGELRFRAATGRTAAQLGSIPVPVSGSIAGTVLSSGRPAVVTDAQQVAGHYSAVGKQTGLETHSLLAVPLQLRDRRIGVLEVINKRRADQFSVQDTELLLALASQAAAAIESARLVEALRSAAEKLGELDRLKSEFIAVASHELRTPLSLILGYASYLRDDIGPEAASKVDIVLQAARRLQEIIETLLNLRYLETGEILLNATRFDLRGMVRDVCEGYRPIAAANEVTLERDLPAGPVMLWADREKTQVVLDNLLSNAIRFNVAGGRVLVAVRQLGDEVALRVADTGIGIPANSLGRVFQRFTQLEDHLTRRRQGLGLGLSIVKGLVECQGGRVWVESILGQGSCFFVVLPCGSALVDPSGSGV